MNRVSRWWYGPLTTNREDLRFRVGIGPGSITVQTLQEAIRAASSVVQAWADGLDPQGTVDLDIHSTAHETVKHYQLDELEDAGEVDLNELNVSLQTSGLYCSLHISKSGSFVSASGGMEPASVDAATRAIEAVIRVIEHEITRRTPWYRVPQVSSAAGVLLLAATWLWTMLTTSPPTPVWILSLLVTAAPAWLLWSHGAERSREGVEGPRHLTVDTTPRAELKSQRYNARQDWKQRLWTAGVVGPVGAGAGVLLKTWFDNSP